MANALWHGCIIQPVCVALWLHLATMSRYLTFLFAVASGLAVANCYFAQPLLDAIANEFGISLALAGSIVTSTQVGYALGLILIVPLGDLVDRKQLVVALLALATLALLAVAFAPDPASLLIAMAAVGMVAVLAQILVAYAALIAGAERQGVAVANVTLGIIVGILLARAASGFLADLLGWRSVYIVSAAAVFITASAFLLSVPRSRPSQQRMSYTQLLLSVGRLFREEPLLRSRALLALFIFTAISMLATPMVLPLGAPPYNLSRSEIGLFGFSGLAGMVGARFAGKMADRGHAHSTTGSALALMLLAWLFAAALPYSLVVFALGLLVMDFTVQVVHVSNQSVIYPLRAEAKSRIVAGYMVFYSIGVGLGSVISTLVYARIGWNGVCITGAVVAALAFLFWLGTTRPRTEPSCAKHA